MKYDYRKSKQGKSRFKYKKIYLITNFIQRILHFIGIAWHNNYFGECTKDFNCCNDDIGKWCWLRLKKKR